MCEVKECMQPIYRRSRHPSKLLEVKPVWEEGVVSMSSSCGITRAAVL